MGLSCRSRFRDASVHPFAEPALSVDPPNGLGGVLPLVVAVNCQDVMALFCECRLNEPTGCQGFTRVCPLPILRLRPPGGQSRPTTGHTYDHVSLQYNRRDPIRPAQAVAGGEVRTVGVTYEGDSIVAPIIEKIIKVVQMTVQCVVALPRRAADPALVVPVNNGEVIDHRCDLAQVVREPRPAVQEHHRRPASCSPPLSP